MKNSTKLGTNISLCLSCNCMTHDVIDRIDEGVINVYCGKCQAFKRESELDGKL